MSLILAVQPDRHRAAQLQAMARAHLNAEFVLASSVTQGFQCIGARVPDLLLMDPLLPPAEEAALDDYLRLIGPAAAHVPSLTIPLLAGGTGERSLLGVLRRERTRPSGDGGCEPAVFAEQISTYLNERRRPAQPPWPSAPPAEPVPSPEDVIVDLSSILDEPEADPLILAEPAIELEPFIAVPEPAIDAPKPLETAPEPLIVAPEPLLEAPEPVIIAPEPLVVAPEPMIEAPEPVVQLAQAPDPEPEVLPAVQAPARLPAIARAPAASTLSHQLVPYAPAPVPVVADPVTPATVQQIIEVPTGTGAQVQASVAVNVAVSVQVAAAVNVTAAPKKQGKPRPIQDEWGFFDPGQCGFQALMARLDEIAAKEERDDA